MKILLGLLILFILSACENPLSGEKEPSFGYDFVGEWELNTISGKHSNQLNYSFSDNKELSYKSELNQSQSDGSNYKLTELNQKGQWDYQKGTDSISLTFNNCLKADYFPIGRDSILVPDNCPDSQKYKYQVKGDSLFLFNVLGMVGDSIFHTPTVYLRKL